MYVYVYVHARIKMMPNAKEREREGGKDRDYLHYIYIHTHGWFSPFTVIFVHLGHHIFFYALEPHAIFITSVLYSNAYPKSAPTFKNAQDFTKGNRMRLVVSMCKVGYCRRWSACLILGSR